MPTIKVNGMSCEHCRASVTKALSGLDNVDNVRVDLQKGEASWEETGAVDLEKAKAAVRKIGFEAP